MSYSALDLPIPVTAANGGALEVGYLAEASVVVGDGLFIATVDIEATTDNPNGASPVWRILQAGVAPGYVIAIPAWARAVRAVTSAFTSGTPTAKVAGVIRT